MGGYGVSRERWRSARAGRPSGGLKWKRPKRPREETLWELEACRERWCTAWTGDLRILSKEMARGRIIFSNFTKKALPN